MTDRQDHGIKISASMWVFCTDAQFKELGINHDSLRCIDSEDECTHFFDPPDDGVRDLLRGQIPNMIDLPIKIVGYEDYTSDAAG